MSRNEQPVADAVPAAPPASALRPRPATWMLAVLLGLVTLAAYFPAFRSGFIEFDDPQYIVGNPHVRTGLNWNNISWAFSATALDMGIWQPVTWLSHMADCQLYGLNPAGHHATSVVLHAINAVLLFLLLYKATGYRWRSLMVAALFALHPLNVENVAWVSERKSILSMLFSLCMIGLYGWYARAPRWPRYLAVAAAFLLALLAKPMAVTVPVLLLLLDYWPLNRISAGESGARLWRLAVEKVPLLCMSAIFSWIAVLSEKHARAIGVVPAYQRLENAALSYVVYIRKMLWPSDLAYFYPLRSAISWWHALLAALLLLAISGLIYRLRQRRHLVFGWALFLVTLLPVIGVFQIGLFSMADRYAYVPLIGLFVALVWELAELASKLRLSPSVQMGAGAAVVAVLACCTTVTAGYWRNDLTLFEHAHRVTSPPNVMIETNLAGALSDEGRLPEALAAYRRAESLEPSSFFTHYNVGYTAARTQDFAGAADEFHQALRFAATPAEKARAWNSLGIACLNLDDRQQALEAFTHVLALAPDNVFARARIESLRRGERE